MDLAMTTIFGGFDADFYQAYKQSIRSHPVCKRDYQATSSIIYWPT
jgi:fructosamine-3-kinase